MMPFGIEIGFGMEAGTPALTPLQIPGLLIWLRADMRVTSSGGLVSSWGDMGSAGLTFSEATNKPTLTANAINGQPGITFNGVSTLLTATGFSGPAAAECFIVGKLANDPPGVSSKTGFWHFGSGTDDALPYIDGKIYDAFGTTARKTTVNPAPSMASPFVYSVRTAAGAWSNYLNSTTALFTTAVNTVGWTSSPVLGRSTGSPNVFAEGTFCDFLVYNRILASSERTLNYAYFTDRYAITIA